MTSNHLGRAWILALAIGTSLAPGCGGDGDTRVTGAAAPGTRGGPPPPVSGFQPSSSGGSGSFAGGGGGGFSGGVSGGGFSGGGGGGGHAHLGGAAGILVRREQRRREAIERAHRGPVRLTGLDEDQQRTADWGAATTSAHPVTGVDDDQCERIWAQHVATTEAYHSRRQDGLHSSISSTDERNFLRTCRTQSPQMQQCLDRAYLQEHEDECHAAREQDPHRLDAARQAAVSRDHPQEF